MTAGHCARVGTCEGVFAISRKADSSVIACAASGGTDEKDGGVKKEKLKHRLLLPLLAVFLSAYGRLIFLTSRVRVITPIPDDLAGPVVIASWHQQISMLPAIGRPVKSRLLALVADSRAGNVIRAVAARHGIDTVSGSTRRGGSEGARSMISAAREGHSLFITPDGSSGPGFVAKRGATKISCLAGVPLVPCAAWSRRGKTFDTWDKFRLPYPFTTIVVAYGDALPQPQPESLGEALDALSRRVREEALSAG